MQRVTILYILMYISVTSIVLTLERQKIISPEQTPYIIIFGTMVMMFMLLQMFGPRPKIVKRTLKPYLNKRWDILELGKNATIHIEERKDEKTLQILMNIYYEDDNNKLVWIGRGEQSDIFTTSMYVQGQRHNSDNYSILLPGSDRFTMFFSYPSFKSGELVLYRDKKEIHKYRLLLKGVSENDVEHIYEQEQEQPIFLSSGALEEEQKKREEEYKRVSKSNVIHYDENDDMVVTPVTKFMVPVGTIMPYVGIDLPEGFLWCDGETIPNEKKYEELRSVVSLKYGGSRVATPDLRDRTIKGMDIAVRTSDMYGGADGVVLEKNQIASHFHSMNLTGHGIPETNGVFEITSSDTDYANENRKSKDDNRQFYTILTHEHWSNQYNPLVFLANETKGTFDSKNIKVSSDESVAHNNIQPTKIVNFIIKY